MELSSPLAIRMEIDALLADYWHDVDHNWGRTAHAFYTEQGVFESSAGRTREGRAAIQAFYTDRHARGERVSRHLVCNLRVSEIGERSATARWVLLLHAADGQPVLPSEPPILIADVTDRCERAADGRWQIAYRRIDAMFKGEKATTA